jgi:glycosyltransferase involved in cell wall biosynthesis
MISSAHLIGTKGIGGAERFFVRLVRALRDDGHPTLVVTRSKSPLHEQLGDWLPGHRVPMKSTLDLWSMWRIHQIIARRRPRIVQTYMGRATWLTRLRRGRVPVHIAMLGGFYHLYGYRHAHAWVGNARAICDYLIRNGFPADRVFLIRNFVEPAEPAPRERLEDLRRAQGIPEDALVVLGVGRLVEKKGFQDLLDALALAPPSVGGRPVHLLLVGAGEIERRLRDQASALGVSERVHWAGWQSEPGPFYQLADIFVCPSRIEPLGNVILEAWNHGTPVLSTRTHGGEELITHGLNGILTPCADSRALASDLERLLKEEERTRRSLGEEGRRTVVTEYAPADIVHDYLGLYADLLEERA